MKIQIKSPDFAVNNCLRGFVTGKIARLSALYDRISGAEVTLKRLNSGDIDDCLCEVRLYLSGNDVFASKDGETFEDAVRDAINALRKQVLSLKRY